MAFDLERGQAHLPNLRISIPRVVSASDSFLKVIAIAIDQDHCTKTKCKPRAVRKRLKRNGKKVTGYCGFCEIRENRDLTSLDNWFY